MTASPAPTPDPVRVARSRLANAIRRGDDPADTRRILTREKLRRAIADALNDAHPPSVDERIELADLLSGGAR